MPALFESEWDGQDNSNYGWSAVSIYEADGTETGQSCGVDIRSMGDEVVPDADIPRLITALQAYIAASGQLTPADRIEAVRAFLDDELSRDDSTLAEIAAEVVKITLGGGS